MIAQLGLQWLEHLRLDREDEGQILGLRVVCGRSRDRRTDLEAMDSIGLPGDFDQRVIEAKQLAVSSRAGDELVGTKVG